MVTFIVIASVVLLLVVLGYFRHKRAKDKVVHVIEENCTGCQLCFKKCRHKAIEIIKVDSRRRAVISPDKCTTCGDCISACKFNALEVIRRI